MKISSLKVEKKHLQTSNHPLDKKYEIVKKFNLLPGVLPGIFLFVLEPLYVRISFSYNSYSIKGPRKSNDLDQSMTTSLDDVVDIVTSGGDVARARGSTINKKNKKHSFIWEYRLE